MKGLKRSGFMKAFAAVLLFVSVVASAVLSLLLFAIYEYGGLYDGGLNMVKNILSDICYYNANAIGEYYGSKLMGYTSDAADITFAAKFDTDKTNVRFSVLAPDGSVYFSNIDDNEVFVSSTLTRDISRIVQGDKVDKLCSGYEAAHEYYNELRNEGHVLSFEITETDISKLPFKATAVLGVTVHKDFSVVAAIPSTLQPVDGIYLIFNTVTFVAQYFYVFIGVLCAVLLLAVLLVIFIISSAGYKPNEEAVRPGFFARMPLDIYCAIILLIANAYVWVLDTSRHELSAFLISTVIALVLLIGSLFSISARLKVKGWYKNLLVFRIIGYLYRLLKKFITAVISVLSRIGLFWKTCVYLVLQYVLCFIGAMTGREEGVIIVSAVLIINALVLIKFVLDLRKLEACGKEIASGNIQSKIDSPAVLPSLRVHASSLNGIGGGLEEALEKSIKSERMKSELITNVSHDIKTPLTSIVNYVGLLKKEGLDSENAQGYVEVLEKQSMRLKKMTEDLMEASKAASGRISVNSELIDVGIALEQALGEYREKLDEAELDVVKQIGADECNASADGKLLWRILDNILGNACKYAMRKTRLYISLQANEETVDIVFKNVSATPLNIDAEELTERFVRGDGSRNTEGSGLGLSIAKSLTELQKGSFNVNIDGDLFKVTVSLKKA